MGLAHLRAMAAAEQIAIALLALLACVGLVLGRRRAHRRQAQHVQQRRTRALHVARGTASASVPAAAVRRRF